MYTLSECAVWFPFDVRCCLFELWLWSDLVIEMQVRLTDLLMYSTINIV